jgi:DNA modification methylase
MSYDVVCRVKPYIQPFERQLALRELAALAGADPAPLPALVGPPDQFRVRSRTPATTLARELAFWEVVASNKPITTRQSLRESTTNVARNGTTLEEIAHLLPFNGSVPLPNRRCLRYGSHGIHEYRGKFFPQLVRTLINVANAPRGALIADPFCGSGTTAVETMLAHRKAIALDMNPLSVFVARAKCAVLGVGPKQLESAYTPIRRALLSGAKQSRKYSRIATACEHDLRYLAAWFHPRVLDELDRIYATILINAGGAVRDFFLVNLSNVLRRVSWQKEDDLRVRRETEPVKHLDPVSEFLDQVDRSFRLLVAFLRQEGPCPRSYVSITQGDAKAIPELWANWKDKIDLVITSPPYATALPYIDTDRLSLCFLGLLPRYKHREWDQQMIGNREINERIRKAYWHKFISNDEPLPESVAKLIRAIHRLNLNGSTGFRRRNLPSLLYKYFSDMRQVLVSLRQVMRRGASAFIVVGNNHTVAGGKRFEIPTAKLLSEIANDVGFKSLNETPMEMLVSRDLFRKNAIASETILHLQRP